MVNHGGPNVEPGMDVGDKGMSGGRRVRGATAKDLKKMLKKAGLKTSGKKAALTRRAKKAHLKIRGGTVIGGDDEPVEPPSMGGGAGLQPSPLGGMEGGRRRGKRSRKSRGYKLF